MKGYIGRIATIDLASGEKTIRSLDQRLIHDFIGGRGFISYWMYKNIHADTGPLDEDNLLIFASGPCNGTIVPSSTRGSVGAKSPLTKILGSGNTGSQFSVLLKRAGYDMLIIRAKAQAPSYLFINDNNISVIECPELWGKITSDVTYALRTAYGYRNVSVACIGPAGERRVAISSIIFDRFRSAGRGGLGAVMGSKNLKAIVLKGTGGIKAAHPGKLKREVLRYIAALEQEPYFERYSNEGSAVIAEPMNKMGCALVKDGTSGFFEDINGLSPDRIKKEIVVRQKACFSCPMPCTQQYAITEGPYRGTYGEGSSGASVVMGFGPRCGVSDIKAIAKAHTLTNELGIDLISANAVLAFGTECFEKGLISLKDTDGVRLEFGNAESQIAMIQDIAFSRGFGKILGQGTRTASEIIGGQSERFAPHVKGMDMMEAEPRGMPSWALMFAVSSRGADHMRAYDVCQMMPFSDEELIRISGTPKVKEMFSPEGKGRSVVFFENIRAVADSMEVCRFVTRGKLGFPENLVTMLNMVTGLNFTSENLYTAGERIVNLERLFNLKAGMTVADDTLPERYLQEPLPDGAAEGKTVPLQDMLAEYYGARDWDLETGCPSAQKLKSLNLETK
jgi:aldehyde:ferredoxin oxidoreductase